MCQASGHVSSFKCPKGTRFDQRHMVCNWSKRGKNNWNLITKRTLFGLLIYIFFFFSNSRMWRGSAILHKQQGHLRLSHFIYFRTICLPYVSSVSWTPTRLSLQINKQTNKHERTIVFRSKMADGTGLIIYLSIYNNNIFIIIICLLLVGLLMYLKIGITAINEEIEKH